MPISSFKDFVKKFEALKTSSNLFIFFLFEDPPSLEAENRFANDNFQWLESLASREKIFLNIFLRRDHDAERVINPSPEVAKLFGLPPDQLPGVVLFTLSEDKASVSKSIFLPLEAKLFAAGVGGFTAGSFGATPATAGATISGGVCE